MTINVEHGTEELLLVDVEEAGAADIFGNSLSVGDNIGGFERRRQALERRE